MSDVVDFNSFQLAVQDNAFQLLRDCNPATLQGRRFQPGGPALHVARWVQDSFSIVQALHPSADVVVISIAKNKKYMSSSLSSSSSFTFTFYITFYIITTSVGTYYIPVIGECLFHALALLPPSKPGGRCAAARNKDFKLHGLRGHHDNMDFMDFITDCMIAFIALFPV